MRLGLARIAGASPATDAPPLRMGPRDAHPRGRGGRAVPGLLPGTCRTPHLLARRRIASCLLLVRTSEHHTCR
jgi:hypothetical protein